MALIEMFDFGADELLLTAAVAIIAIGPKDLPRAMMFAGRWIGKARRMSGGLRAGVEKMVRDAEIGDLESEWAARREEILAQYANKESDREPLPPADGVDGGLAADVNGDNPAPLKSGEPPIA